MKTTKVYYVGSDPYLNLMAQTGKPLREISEIVGDDAELYLTVMQNEGMSLDEIVGLIDRENYSIDQNGNLVPPPESVSASESEVENTLSDDSNVSKEKTDDNEKARPIKKSSKAAKKRSEISDTELKQSDDINIRTIGFVAAIIALAGGGMAMLAKKMKKSDNTETKR